jgi:hypothetical protein
VGASPGGSEPPPEDLRRQRRVLDQLLLDHGGEEVAERHRVQRVREDERHALLVVGRGRGQQQPALDVEAVAGQVLDGVDRDPLLFEIPAHLLEHLVQRTLLVVANLVAEVKLDRAPQALDIARD